MSADVQDHPEASRFEITVDGELAGWVDYRVDGDVYALPHTRVLPAFEGQPDRYVVWGDGTTDEMCLGMLMVTRP